MNKKKAVVVGYGGMGGWHVERLQKSDVCTLGGIYDIDPAKKQKAIDNGIKSYDSLEEIIADKDVELVTVAIPNDVHEEVVKKLLDGGKNVICEKPIALNIESLERMIECAKKNNVKLSVHQNRRWDVDFLAVKAIKENGKLGEIFNIESRVMGSRGIPSDWRGKKEFGGGMLYDWGIHLIDQILQIFDGKVVKIYCRLDNITNKEVDDGFKLELIFENNARAFIELGTYNFVKLPRFYVQGMKGTGIIDNWREPLKYTICKYWHESDVLPVETAAGLTKTMAPRDSVTVDYRSSEIPESDVHDYYRNFVAAIDGKEELLVSFEDMIRDLKVIEAAFKSAELNQVIDVNL